MPADNSERKTFMRHSRFSRNNIGVALALFMAAVVPALAQQSVVFSADAQSGHPIRNRHRRQF
jgi:hypothetical protein